MADPENYDIEVEGGVEVALPSGSVFYVLTDSEKKFIEDKIARYMTDNHFCLPAGELVTTARGPIPVEMVRTDDRVLGLNEAEDALSWQGVVANHQLSSQALLKVRTGNRTLRCSPGHRILVREYHKGARGRPARYVNVWRRAEHLERDDILAIQDGAPAHEVKQGTGLDFIEFCGLFLGDGLTVAGRYVRICRAEDATYMDHYRATIPMMFTKVNGEPVVLAERGYTEFGSKSAVEMLEGYGLCGGSRGKRVPEWVHLLGRKGRLAFLRGYVDADGHVDAKGRIWFGSPNGELIEAMRHLCISVGVPVNNVNVTTNEFGPVYAFLCWDPVANAEIGTNDTRYSFAVERELRHDGKYLDRYGKGWVAPEHTRYSRVLEVSIEPAEPVFDLVVDGGHSFVASGVVTHNTNIADLSELDKIVSAELLIHRWSLWVLRRQDYYGDDIHEKQLADLINDYTTQVRGLKKLLGIDKVTRDRSHGDESVAARWDDVKRRALEFGVFRNDQASHCIESFQRLKAMLQFHDNCNDQERIENRCRVEDVIEVLREEIGAFDKLDADFKQGQQRYWIRKQ